MWRVGRRTHDPFSLPPVHLQGKGRFDSPELPASYRTLYCADSVRSVLVEVLQQYRLSLREIQRSADAAPMGVNERDDMRESVIAPSGYIPAAFLEDYRLCYSLIRCMDPIVNISSTRAIEQVRHDLVNEFIEHEIEDFDLSVVSSLDREVTQQISLWAWQQGYAGISYVSRFGADLTCYALFEDRYELIDTPECIPVGKSDDLLDAADTLRLHLPR
ncbi:MAG: RES family NAD+ phosphorylase [Thermomicrobiales bacterium]|nr:RES family NAD+ phosphorylase [Thermomicrobiales bacterium]